MSDPTLNQVALEERVNARQAEARVSHDRLRVEGARRKAEADEHDAKRTLQILGIILVLLALLVTAHLFRG